MREQAPSGERVSDADLIRADCDWVGTVESGVEVGDRVLRELLKEGHDGQSNVRAKASLRETCVSPSL